MITADESFLLDSAVLLGHFNEPILPLVNHVLYMGILQFVELFPVELVVVVLQQSYLLCVGDVNFLGVGLLGMDLETNGFLLLGHDHRNLSDHLSPGGLVLLAFDFDYLLGRLLHGLLRVWDNSR